MINILLVDDSNDKVASVIKTIREVSDKIIIDVAIDFISAMEYLTSNQVDLIILDINLPIRKGEEPAFSTGKKLLEEISRKSNILKPYYILGLTQYSEAVLSFSEIWPTINYTPETVEWKKPVSDLIRHILSCNLPKHNILDIKPTIFLEGNTDRQILSECFRLFRPDLTEKILLKSTKSAGAAWVCRQIIAWSYSLQKKEGNYVKAIGLLDGDIAGQIALSEINRVINLDSAERKTFKIIQLSASYATHIIPIIQKGLNLPITLEEMFKADIWELASNEKWLEARTNAETLLKDPSKWNKYDLSLKDYLNTIGLLNDEKLYLSTVKDDCKLKLIQHIKSLNDKEKIKALNCFEKLIGDISDYFALA